MTRSTRNFRREACVLSPTPTKRAPVAGIPSTSSGQALLAIRGRDALDTNRHGGTIINIIFALIFFGLLAFGIMWLIKSFGEAGQQYSNAMVDTQLKAVTVKCQTNLRAIGQNIQMYAISNEGFPPSQQELVEFGGSTQLFRCPAPDGEKYVYIPGQNGSMPPSNVLVYEPKPIHDGRCGVLRLGGQLELLTPEELQQALEQTQANIR